jgi:hypothetical protein
MALGGAQLAAELLLNDRRRVIDPFLQREYWSAWKNRFGPTIARAQQLGWLLRRPWLLRSLIRCAPVPRCLEELLLRACYRTTRLPA